MKKNSSHTPRLAQNRLFLLRINIARFNTRKYIKEYFGARYFLKVLKFFIFILFSLFFFHLKILSPESRVQSWFYKGLRRDEKRRTADSFVVNKPFVSPEME